MTGRRPILLAAHPTVGHTSALRAIGAELRARGHATSFAIVHARLPFASLWPEPVRVASGLPGLLTEEGADVLELTASPASLWHAARLPMATGQAELEIALALFTSGLERHALQIAAHARRMAASAVVGDYLMPAALLGARLAELPFVAVYHSALPFPADGTPPFGTGLRETDRGTDAWTEAEARLARMSAVFDARIEDAARRLRLEAPGSGLLQRPISSDLNLLATAPELEPGLRPLAGNVLMTGPCLPKAIALDEAGQSVLDALPHDRRIVYVSLGTVFNDRPAVFRTLIGGAAAAGVHVVVSAGASFEALADLRSASVQIHRRVPQVSLLERVDAVITHGGNNTVQECLSAGRPMLVFPFGGDQVANAHRVERLGVGARMSAAALSMGAVDVAVRKLAEPSIVARASELARSLGRYGGTHAAADAVNRLVQSASEATRAS
jgi:MGT family glycosyltransferase